MNIDAVRRFALSLPEVTEEPHFQFSSFRVKGKIFVTVPPEGGLLHVFVDEAEREIMTAAQPMAFEKLWWGKKVVGLRVKLARAKARDVEELVHSAWQKKAPKRLAQAYAAAHRPED
jgi:hypothetical protein